MCLWFVSRDKTGKHIKGGGRDRRGETLFIDARELGYMETRTQRVLSGVNGFPAAPGTDIGRIVRTYHAWRGEPGPGNYEDVPGFCNSATLDEIRQHRYILTPGRYVVAATVEGDSERFEELMQRLTAEVQEQFTEADQLEAQIRSHLKVLGYGG